MKSQEIPITKEHLISFYAQELMISGSMENESEAILYAALEIEFIGKALTFFHILTSDGLQVGYLIYFFEEDFVYLEAIFIKEEYRGLGIGKDILRGLEEVFLNNDINSIKLFVFAHNQAAYRLYSKLGYVVEGVTENNNKVIGFYMKKNIISAL